MTPYQRAIDTFKNKKVLIFGLGLLGGAVGDARFFTEIGASVRVTDQKSENVLAPSLELLKNYNIETSLGGHKSADIEWADFIIRNPSIPKDHPLLAQAKVLNKPVYMRTALFMELSGLETIGITGTRGKTTTTSMIYEIAKQLSTKKVYMGGNVAGISDLEHLKEIVDPSNELAILELSSWALQGLNDLGLSPHIAVVTNLYPDHLNVYKDLPSYYQDKEYILKHQTSSDFAVLNDHQLEFHQWVEHIQSTPRWFSSQKVPNTLTLKIKGEHNIQNAAAALAVASIMGWSELESISILNNFSGVPYRLQTIAVKNGVSYINDTTATTPVATIIALKSMTAPPILICGGNDKNLPIEQLAAEVNRSTKIIILLPGTGTNKLLESIGSTTKTHQVKSMQEAVAYAHQHSESGDTVLMSPGFTSFGLFNNEFDRGDQFNQCVQNLA